MGEVAAHSIKAEGRPRRFKTGALGAVASSGGIAHPATSPLRSDLDPGLVAMGPIGKKT